MGANFNLNLYSLLTSRTVGANPMYYYESFKSRGCKCTHCTHANDGPGMVDPKWWHYFIIKIQIEIKGLQKGNYYLSLYFPVYFQSEILKGIYNLSFLPVHEVSSSEIHIEPLYWKLKAGRIKAMTITKIINIRIPIIKVFFHFASPFQQQPWYHPGSCFRFWFKTGSPD